MNLVFNSKEEQTSALEALENEVAQEKKRNGIRAFVASLFGGILIFLGLKKLGERNIMKDYEDQVETYKNAKIEGSV